MQLKKTYNNDIKHITMKDLYFKVIKTQKIDIFDIDEMRGNPCYEIYIAENEEKLITVSYKPTKEMIKSEFIKAIIKSN